MDIAGVALLVLALATVVMVRVAAMVRPVQEQEESAGQGVRADAPEPSGERPGGLGVADRVREAL